MFYSPHTIAVLPEAPRNGSPVPWLTSLYHSAEAGPYGNRGYPGNCGGKIIKDLLRYFSPRNVLDPMTGSGTCMDVCRVDQVTSLQGRTLAIQRTITASARLTSSGCIPRTGG